MTRNAEGTETFATRIVVRQGGAQAISRGMENAYCIKAAKINGPTHYDAHRPFFYFPSPLLTGENFTASTDRLPTPEHGLSQFE